MGMLMDGIVFAHMHRWVHSLLCDSLMLLKFISFYLLIITTRVIGTHIICGSFKFMGLNIVS